MDTGWPPMSSPSISGSSNPFRTLQESCGGWQREIRRRQDRGRHRARRRRVQPLAGPTDRVAGAWPSVPYASRHRHHTTRPAPIRAEPARTVSVRGSDLTGPSWHVRRRLSRALCYRGPSDSTISGRPASSSIVADRCRLTSMQVATLALHGVETQSTGVAHSQMETR